MSWFEEYVLEMARLHCTCARLRPSMSDPLSPRVVKIESLGEVSFERSGAVHSPKGDEGEDKV